jgi:hypothetical protein
VVPFHNNATEAGHAMQQHINRVLVVAMLCVASFVLATSEVHAQACASYPGITYPTDATAKTCFDTCCTTLSQCFTTNKCTVKSDWPRGMSVACQTCDTQQNVCFGSCLLPSWPKAVVPTAECSFAGNFCSFGGFTCGMPDGCGGTCDSGPKCAFLYRRPEFAPVLYLF